MTWSILVGNKPVAATPPSPEQIAPVPAAGLGEDHAAREQATQGCAVLVEDATHPEFGLTLLLVQPRFAKVHHRRAASLGLRPALARMKLTMTLVDEPGAVTPIFLPLRSATVL